MSRPRFRASLTTLAAGLACFQAGAATSADVSISIKSGNPRSGPIPDDFLGISLESSSIAAANNGGREWLSGTSGAFSTMMTRIGVKSVRIGGNSAERTGYPTFTDARCLRCGCPPEFHQHLRAGDDCGRCGHQKCRGYL